MSSGAVSSVEHGPAAVDLVSLDSTHARSTHAPKSKRTYTKHLEGAPEGTVSSKVKRFQ